MKLVESIKDPLQPVKPKTILTMNLLILTEIELSLVNVSEVPVPEVSSTGISCNRDNGDNGGGGTGNVANANDLEDLECDELLRRFRNADTDQYGDKARFADVDVSNQIIVCLEQEVVQGTAADGELPDTGGVSLLALAALGIVSAIAGVSVIRGARREE